MKRASEFAGARVGYPVGHLHNPTHASSRRGTNRSRHEDLPVRDVFADHFSTLKPRLVPGNNYMQHRLQKNLAGISYPSHMKWAETPN
jgi:hypothetical protein